MNRSKKFLENFYNLIFSIINIKIEFLKLKENPSINCTTTNDIKIDGNTLKDNNLSTIYHTMYECIQDTFKYSFDFLENFDDLKKAIEFINNENEAVLPPYLIQKILNNEDYRIAVKNLKKLKEEFERKNNAETYLPYILDVIQMTVIAKLRKGILIPAKNFSKNRISEGNLSSLRKYVTNTMGKFDSRLIQEGGANLKIVLDYPHKCGEKIPELKTQPIISDDEGKKKITITDYNVLFNIKLNEKPKLDFFGNKIEVKFKLADEQKENKNQTYKNFPEILKKNEILNITFKNIELEKKDIIGYSKDILKITYNIHQKIISFKGKNVNFFSITIDDNNNVSYIVNELNIFNKFFKKGFSISSPKTKPRIVSISAEYIEKTGNLEIKLCDNEENVYIFEGQSIQSGGNKPSSSSKSPLLSESSSNESSSHSNINNFIELIKSIPRESDDGSIIIEGDFDKLQNIFKIYYNAINNGFPEQITSFNTNTNKIKSENNYSINIDGQTYDISNISYEKEVENIVLTIKENFFRRKKIDIELEIGNTYKEEFKKFFDSLYYYYEKKPKNKKPSLLKSSFEKTQVQPQTLQQPQSLINKNNGSNNSKLQPQIQIEVNNNKNNEFYTGKFQNVKVGNNNNNKKVSVRKDQIISKGFAIPIQKITKVSKNNTTVEVDYNLSGGDRKTFKFKDKNNANAFFRLIRIKKINVSVKFVEILNCAEKYLPLSTPLTYNIIMKHKDKMPFLSNENNELLRNDNSYVLYSEKIKSVVGSSFPNFLPLGKNEKNNECLGEFCGDAFTKKNISPKFFKDKILPYLAVINILNNINNKTNKNFVNVIQETGDNSEKEIEMTIFGTREQLIHLFPDFTPYHHYIYSFKLEFLNKLIKMSDIEGKPSKNFQDPENLLNDSDIKDINIFYTELIKNLIKNQSNSCFNVENFKKIIKDIPSPDGKDYKKILTKLIQNMETILGLQSK